HPGASPTTVGVTSFKQAANASVPPGVGLGGLLGNSANGDILGSTDAVPRGGGGDSEGIKHRGHLQIPVDAGGRVNAGASGGVPSKPRRVFAGLPGAIHPDSGAEDKGRWAGTDPESFLRENLSLTDLVSLAYMFNFSSESVVLSLGERKASVQVEESEWSKPFSMETVGVNQVLSVRHPSKGTLELGFTIVVPPGRLGQFTKVVQFWPRLLVVNRLGRSLLLEQNSTLRQRSERVAEVPAGHGQPFHLPQTGYERELRVKVSGGWERSASFPVDSVGEYSLRLTRKVDVSGVKHISTRRSSEYDVVIPCMEDVGVWLETDWYRKQAVIKEIKKDSYAFKHTELQVR
ncbi:unnamed protein product, partial [Sphacelaria rigidula]